VIVLVAAALSLFADPQQLSDKALEFASRRQFAQAEQLWLQALEASPNFFPAAFNLGYMYYSTGQPAKAEPHLARAVQIAPKDFNARYLLGGALSQSNKTDEALRQWRAALAGQPKHAKLLQLMAVEYGKGRYFREAAAVAERAIAVAPEEPTNWLLAINAFQEAGVPATALRLAREMVSRFPDSARANFEYGYELHRSGQIPASIPYLKKAMDLDASYEEPLFFFGEILLSEKKHEEAAVALRKAVELKPGYMAARVALARALMNTGRLEEAKAELERAAEIDRRHPQPHVLLSQLYFRLGDEARAAQEKNLSLKLRRENPEAMLSRQGRPFPAEPAR
jgi:tetratricopeptide (TPR) repeat protein